MCVSFRMTSSQVEVVNVRREKLAACMTCPLCLNLFTQATTISECLHSFCKKCIHQKIIDEDLNCCPVCKTYLGCSPLEKLRPDHNLEDLRAKIFPLDKQKNKEPKAVPSIPLPPRRKERSLSSLVPSSPLPPRGLAQSGRPVRRARYAKKIYDYEIPSSPETLGKTLRNKRQNSSKAGSSKQHMHNKVTESNSETLEGRTDVWKPLNRLVDASSNTKSNTPSLPVTLANIALPNPPENKAPPFSGKSKDRGDESGSTPALSGSEMSRKLQGNQRRKAVVAPDLNIPVQPVTDENDQRLSPVWFSLVSSSDQIGNTPLPQIQSCYLRVKDDRLPVAFIQKYLMKKLNLASESEVEISFLGKPVIPTIQLHSLMEQWLRAAPKSEKLQASAGDSAKDVVMALSYGRKRTRHP